MSRFGNFLNASMDRTDSFTYGTIAVNRCDGVNRCTKLSKDIDEHSPASDQLYKTNADIHNAAVNWDEDEDNEENDGDDELYNVFGDGESSTNGYGTVLATSDADAFPRSGDIQVLTIKEEPVLHDAELATSDADTFPRSGAIQVLTIKEEPVLHDAELATSDADTFPRSGDIQVLTIKEEPVHNEEEEVVNNSNKQYTWPNHSMTYHTSNQSPYDPNLTVKQEPCNISFIEANTEGFNSNDTTNTESNSMMHLYQNHCTAEGSGTACIGFYGNEQECFADQVKYEQDSTFTSANMDVIPNLYTQQASNGFNRYNYITETNLSATGDTSLNEGDDDTGIEITVDTTYKMEDNKAMPKKEYKCQVCGRVFAKSSNRLRHMLTHTGERAFTCKICGKKFKQNNNLKNHMFVHCEDKLHTCDICNKSFKLPGHLTQHRRSHTGVKPYECSFCDKTYAKNATLKQHMKMHTGQYLHACMHCDKSFTELKHLHQHMLIHTEEQPLQCEVCQESFSRMILLQQHMMLHSRETVYACEFCDKTFKEIAHLQEHTKRHTGDMAYMCDVCPKGFAHLRSLRRHMQMHRRDQEFQCTECDQTFYHASEREEHTCVMDGSVHDGHLGLK